MSRFPRKEEEPKEEVDLTPLYPVSMFSHANGWRTQSLFYEMIGVDQLNQGIRPLYRLNASSKRKRVDEVLNKENLIDLHSAFIKLNDPTGYMFSLIYLGGYAHFKKLNELVWWQSRIEGWNEELEVKMRAGAITSIMDAAVSGDGSNATSAAKWIADRGWKKTRGRPSKAEVAKERKIQAGIVDEIDNDAQRLGLH